MSTGNYPDVTLNAYNNNKSSFLFSLLFIIIVLYLLTYLVFAANIFYYNESLNNKSNIALNKCKKIFEQFQFKLNKLPTNKSFLTIEEGKMILKELDCRSLVRLDNNKDYLALSALLDVENKGLFNISLFIFFVSIFMPKESSTFNPESSNYNKKTTNNFLVKIAQLNIWPTISHFMNIFTLAGLCMFSFFSTFSIRLLSNFMNLCSIVFLILEIFQMIDKGFFKYIFGLHNSFQMFVSFLAFIIFAIQIIDTNLLNDEIVFKIFITLSILRITRLFSLLMIIKNFKILFLSFKNFLRPFLILIYCIFIIFYIYAILGTQMYGGLIYIGNPDIKNDSPSFVYSSFNDIGIGFMTLFSSILLNDWFVIIDMYTHATKNRLPRIFFVSFFFVINYYLVNMILSIIIDSYYSTFSIVNSKEEDLPDSEIQELINKITIDQIKEK